MSRFTLPCLLVVLLGSGFAQEPAAARRLQTLEPAGVVSAYRVVDVDGDGRAELLTVSAEGAVQVFRADGTRWATKPVGKLELGKPAQCLLALADVLPSPGDELVVLDPSGATAYAVDKAGSFVVEGRRLARRARFRLRTGAPRFSNFIQDPNGDGRPDLVVPGFEACDLWLNQSEGDKVKFKKTANVEVRVSVDNVTAHRLGIDDFYHRLRVPDIDIRDVNGDGRADLVVRRSNETRFHRQRPDGTLPFEPDVILDLDKFRDTTAKASVRPGYTLAGTERARRLIRDLDDDGIPDYVIAHRRKVWVFHGAPDGPQFTKPTTILKTADDITAIWLARLDDDDKVDLLLLRIQVPSVGTLITGLLGSFTVELRAIGYASEGGRGFKRKPDWRSELSFRLPSLDKVIRNPDAFIRRFEEAGRTFRRSHEGDFDGDGRVDLALVSADETSIEIWRGRAGAEILEADTYDDVLREILFQDQNTEWDIDRVVAWLETLGSRDFKRRTGGRPADATLTLRNPTDFVLDSVESGDVDGAKGEEVVVSYRDAARPKTRVFDVWKP